MEDVNDPLQYAWNTSSTATYDATAKTLSNTVTVNGQGDASPQYFGVFKRVSSTLVDSAGARGLACPSWVGLLVAGLVGGWWALA